MAGLQYLLAFGSGVKEGFQEGLSEVGTLRIVFGIINWIVLLLFLVALAQKYGILTALGVYLLVDLLLALVKWGAIQDRYLTEQPNVTPPSVTQERGENRVTLTVEETETDGTVILGLAGESNIATHQGTHRELTPGESVTLHHDTDEDTLTIETEEETETLTASEDTEMDVFKHDFLLFESYENAQPAKSHITYGDIQ